MVKMADLPSTVHRPLDRRDQTVRVGQKPGPLHQAVADLAVGQSYDSPDPKRELTHRIRSSFPDRRFTQKKLADGYRITRVK